MSGNPGFVELAVSVARELHESPDTVLSVWSAWKFWLYSQALCEINSAEDEPPTSRRSYNGDSSFEEDKIPIGDLCKIAP